MAKKKTANLTVNFAQGEAPAMQLGLELTAAVLERLAERMAIPAAKRMLANAGKQSIRLARGIQAAARAAEKAKAKK